MKHVVKHLGALVTLLTTAVTIQAQGIHLSSGQSFDYAFSSLQYLGPVSPNQGTALYSVYLEWETGSFETGSSVMLALFETAATDTPFRTGEFQGYTAPPPEPGGIMATPTGGGFIGLEGVHPPAWQDLQGVLRLNVTSGSIVLKALGCETVVDCVNYGGYAVVPEPSSLMLIVMALSTVCLWPRWTIRVP